MSIEIIEENKTTKAKKPIKKVPTKPKPKPKRKMKSRREIEIEDTYAYEQGILRSIQRYVAMNPGYVIGLYYVGGLVVVKSKNMMVTESNSRSMFQPLETSKTIDAALVFIVEYSTEEVIRPEFVKDLIKVTRCKPQEILSELMVREVLDGL